LQYSLPPLRMGASPIISTLFWPFLWIIYYMLLISYLGLDKVGSGLHYLISVVLFMGLAEPLAKDIRDYDNDKRGGKITTVVRYSVPRSAVCSLILSMLGSILWIYTLFQFPNNNVYFFISLAVMFILWISYCFILTKRLFSRFNKKDGRKMHLGYILSFTVANILTIGFFIV
jgi:4-hydroxybenzoate polyprenyltransferase